MKKIIIFTAMLLFGISNSFGQSDKTKSVYAEVGFGFGKTLFFGDTKALLKEGYGATFNPGTAINILMGFSYAPQNWKGFGLGSRITGTIGNTVKGDGNNDDFAFNYYNTAITTKYYPISKEFNKGLYVGASFGFGQFTTERSNKETKLLKHLYGLGTTFTATTGYSFLIGKRTFSIEAQYDYSNRNVGIDGKDEFSLKSGQIGGNIIYSF
jgi:hypothetical protein